MTSDDKRRMPEVIYLQIEDDDGEPLDTGITWCEDKQHDSDVRYVIDKGNPMRDTGDGEER